MALIYGAEFQGKYPVFEECSEASQLPGLRIPPYVPTRPYH